MKKLTLIITILIMSILSFGNKNQFLNDTIKQNDTIKIDTVKTDTIINIVNIKYIYFNKIYDNIIINPYHYPYLFDDFWIYNDPFYYNYIGWNYNRYYF